MLRTRVGYAGGEKDAPTYRSIGDHTEAIQIEFDPELITYEQLLEVFWDAHDPYGRSRSRQYRSVLWTHGETQAEIAKAFVTRRSKTSGRPPKTPILPATTFWIAEDYHQKYRLRSKPNLIRALFGPDVTDETLRDSTLAARVNGWLARHGTPEQIEADVEAFELGEDARAALHKALGARLSVSCR